MLMQKRIAATCGDAHIQPDGTLQSPLAAADIALNVAQGLLAEASPTLGADLPADRATIDPYLLQQSNQLQQPLFHQASSTSP